MIHRGAQVILMRLPTWEVWHLGHAPRQVRRNFDKLKFEEAHRHTCLCCGGKKKPGTTVTLDAGQAYEQAGVMYVTLCFVWALAWVWIHTGTLSVTVFRDHGGSTKLGGGKFTRTLSPLGRLLSDFRSSKLRDISM